MVVIVFAELLTGQSKPQGKEKGAHQDMQE